MEKSQESSKIVCPHCTNDNKNMFSFGTRLRNQVNVHCESCSKDFVHNFDVPSEKMEIPTNEKSNT